MKTQVFQITSIMALALSLVSCGGGSSDGDSGSSLTQNQKDLISGLTDRSTSYYTDLQSRFVSLQNASNSYCSQPDDAGFTALKSEWQNAFTSWMSAQWVILGPIDEKLRYNRIESWPLADSQQVVVSVNQDTGGAVELTETYIADRPVQAQGLPALEYLLFSPGTTSSSISTRECDLMKAISSNLVTISSEVTEEWPSFANDIKNPGPNVQFADLNASINFFANLLLNQLIIIKDNKLGTPLGFNKEGEQGAALIEDGEVWISRQSLPAILANMESLQDLYLDSGGYGIDDFLVSLDETEVNQDITDQMSSIISDIKGLVGEGVTLHDDASDSRLSDLYKNVRTLEVAVQNRVFPAMGASPTFNFNDGD